MDMPVMDMLSWLTDLIDLRLEEKRLSEEES